MEPSLSPRKHDRANTSSEPKNLTCLFL